MRILCCIVTKNNGAVNEASIGVGFCDLEEITVTDNCLHDEVRIFVGVSALGVSSALVYCVMQR